jgi:hypothetical protein
MQPNMPAIANNITIMPTKEPKYVVYGLYDPRDGQLRYIGQTSIGVDARYAQHILGAQRTGSHGKRKNDWIKELLGLKLTPELKILREVENVLDLNRAEMFEIKYYRDFIYCDLTNATDGGEGIRGWIPSEEVRLKFKLAKLGTKRSDETKRKISESTKGVKKSLETKKRMSLAQKRRPSKPSDRKRTMSERIEFSRIQGGRPVKDQFGQRYFGVFDVAQKLGAPYTSVSSAIKKNKPYRGFVFTYICE